MTGVAPLATAEVASSADLAGAAPPADLAGMTFPATAGAAPLAVVEVASSTDSMEVAGSPSVCGSQCAYDCLVPDDYVTEPDVVVFPESIELGDPTVVVPPVVGVEMSATKECHGDRDLKCTRGRVGVDWRPEEQESPKENNEAIVVGAVGSGAPWFLTVWAEGTEVKFMIDTGCQVTILVTFERMCASDPRVRSRLRPFGRRLISADSSSLMVRGELDITIAFPGLSCQMVLVVASIGSEGLLGTEALPSCLPHQLDLRMGQLWADGQLHQQRQAARASAHITSSLVLPPDSEIVAPVSIRSPSGIQPGRCSLIEPKIAITENYGVLVGRTLVDASEWSASFLLVNPSSDIVVLPSFSGVGELVPLSAVLVARSAVVSPGVGQTLPEHLENIVEGSHPSWGLEGRAIKAPEYAHMFPAPGEPVTRQFGVGHVDSLRLVSGPVYKRCW